MTINAKIKRDLTGCHPAVLAIAEADTLEDVNAAFDALVEAVAFEDGGEEADWESGAEVAVLDQAGVSIDKLRASFHE